MQLATHSKMQENGENNDKLNMLNDSVIICSPTPKRTRSKASPASKQGKQVQKARTRLKTFYESPLKHIQKSNLKLELLNKEKKIIKKIQKAKQTDEPTSSILPIEPFEHQESVIILSDNESETCETHNNNNKIYSDKQPTKNNSKDQDLSCYIISDDEKPSSVSDADEDKEEPLPHTSKETGSHSLKAEDIVVVWHNGKNVSKAKSDPPDFLPLSVASCSEVPGKSKKLIKDPSSQKKKGTQLSPGQGKRGKKITKSILSKKKQKQSQQRTSNKNKRNQERKNKENNNRTEHNTGTGNNGEPVAKKAKMDTCETNEKEDNNTLSFVPKYNVTLPRFHCSQKQVSGKEKGPKYITYTRIDYQEGCSNILTASEPLEATHKRGDLRQIVIDGSNVAMLYTNNHTFSERGVELLTRHFRKAGHVVKVFVPHYRRSKAFPLLEKLYAEGVVVFTPSRYIAGKRITPYDDRYILQYATMCGGIVVSADQYRDLYDEKPEWRETIEKRLLMPTFVGDYVMLPEDPLGRGGPKLHEFLRH